MRYFLSELETCVDITQFFRNNPSIDQHIHQCKNSSECFMRHLKRFPELGLVKGDDVIFHLNAKDESVMQALHDTGLEKFFPHNVIEHGWKAANLVNETDQIIRDSLADYGPRADHAFESARTVFDLTMDMYEKCIKPVYPLLYGNLGTKQIMLAAARAMVRSLEVSVQVQAEANQQKSNKAGSSVVREGREDNEVYKGMPGNPNNQMGM